MGDQTSEELKSAAAENGFYPPDSEACIGGGKQQLCGSVFVNAKVNGCLVNGSGSKVIVLCPDGGTTLPIL